MGFGLQVFKHPSGDARATAYPAGIASGYASNIFKGSGVKLVAGGKIEVAAAGETLLGSFAGVEYTDPNTKVRVYSKHWPASQAAEDIVAYVYDDPDIVYEIESDAAMAADDIGEMADFTVAADDTGSTVTGLSNATLAGGSAGTITAQFQIVGLSPRVDNEWTNSAPVVLVRIAEHVHRAAVAAGV